MDVDTLLLKDITWIVNRTDFFSGIIHECSFEELNFALFGAKPNHPIANYVIKRFENQLPIVKLVTPTYINFLGNYSVVFDISDIFKYDPSFKRLIRSCNSFSYVVYSLFRFWGESYFKYGN